MEKEIIHTTDSAIEIFKLLIKKLPAIVDTEDKSFESEAADYALKFLGPSSHLYKSMAKFTFNTFHRSTVNQSFINLTNSIIEYIRTNGIYKDPKRNILQNLSNEWLLSGIGGIILIVFSAGFFVGTLKVDKDAIKYLKENSQLKDSVSLFKSRVFTDSIKYNAQQPNKADSSITK